VVDWLVDREDCAVVPAAVIALVTALTRFAWALLRACWSRWTCCCVGAVFSAPRQAAISSADGVAVVLGAVGPVVGVVSVVAGTGVPDGKNGAQSVNAAEVRSTSVVTARCADVASFCAPARLWPDPVPGPDRPGGLEARGVGDGAAAAAAAAAAVAAVAALWSDSSVALA